MITAANGLQWSTTSTNSGFSMKNPTAKMDNKQKKHLKALGHDLNPVVAVADKGLSPSVIAEIERALHDHELIKVKFAVGDRDTKHALIAAMCEQCNCALVQQIGHLALIYKANPDAKPNLTNIHA